MAKLILSHLLRRGYQPGPQGTSADAAVPIVLVGYSGGSQVAAGTAPLLARTLEVPVKVVSIARVMAVNAGFADIRTWHQLVSDQDPVEALGAAVFPQRWRFASAGASLVRALTSRRRSPETASGSSTAGHRGRNGLPTGKGGGRVGVSVKGNQVLAAWIDARYLFTRSCGYTPS